MQARLGVGTEERQHVGRGTHLELVTPRGNRLLVVPQAEPDDVAVGVPGHVAAAPLHFHHHPRAWVV